MSSMGSTARWRVFSFVIALIILSTACSLGNPDEDDPGAESEQLDDSAPATTAPATTAPTNTVSPTNVAPTEVAPTSTPVISMPGGEYEYSGNFTNGSGGCGMDTAPFFLPRLLVRINGEMVELEQPGFHLNEGIIDQATGLAEVSTGKGPNTEGYQLEFNTDLSASGLYRYTTGAGTCTWDAELELISQ